MPKMAWFIGVTGTSGSEEEFLLLVFKWNVCSLCSWVLKDSLATIADTVT